MGTDELPDFKPEHDEVRQIAERSFKRRTITVGLITAIIPVIVVIIAEIGAYNRSSSQIATSEAGQSARQAQQLGTQQAAESTRQFINQGTEQAGFKTREAIQATREKDHLDDIVSHTQTAEAAHTEVAANLNPYTPQPSVTPNPALDLTDPLQAIEAYFTNLNERKYLAAWGMLHEQFQENCCEDNYSVYEGFWKSAGIVSVIELNIDNQPSRYDVNVLVRLYWDKDGYERSYRYNLIYSLEKEQWLIKTVWGA